MYLLFIFLILFTDVWRWDFSNDVSVHSNWFRGEPNNDGDCAYINPSSSWYDTSCASNFAALCQLKRSQGRVELRVDCLH